MGGKSKSKSSVNTQQQANSTMSNLSQGASKFSDAAKGYGNLQTAMVGQMFPAFGELIKGGMESMQGNPMGQVMGAALGLPIQMETPGFIDDFISKYRPEEPAAAPQAPQQQPYNVNDDMRARMGMGSPYGAYGPYGQPNMYNVGGVRR